VVSQTDTGASVIQVGQQVTLGLKLEALGRPMKVTGITVTRLGNADPSSIGEVTVRRGGQTLATGRFTAGSTKLTLAVDLQIVRLDIVSLDIQANIATGAVSGKTIGLALDGHDAVAVGSGTATVVQAALANHYIGAVPGTIVIDGAFADWDAIKPTTDPAGDTNNSNIDIRDTRATKGNSTISFYVAVDGSLLAGAMAPAAKAVRPGPAGPPVTPGTPGPVVEPPVLVGSDSVKIFIDSDANFTTGSPFQGLMFGADYVLTVTGRERSILTKELFQWSGGSWKPVSGGLVPEAALAGSKMELQLPIAPMGITSSSTVGVYIQASDWRDARDTITTPMKLIDPLQLAIPGDIYHSSDGNNWNWQVKVNEDHKFVDMCVDTNGNAYLITHVGDVYESTGDWTSWTQIVDTNNDDNFVAIAKLKDNIFGLQSDADIYITTKKNAWNLQGTIDANTDWEDLCVDHNEYLYAIRQNVDDNVYQSTDQGKTWAAYGKCQVGDDGDDVINKGITYGKAWNDFYVFVLQSDGDIRYDTNGNTAQPWNAIATSAVDTYVDIAHDKTNLYLWVLSSNGQTYIFIINTAGKPGAGDWKQLGSSGDGSAIAIRERDTGVRGDCRATSWHCGDVLRLPPPAAGAGPTQGNVISA
jgi:hypothetical protein